MNKKIFVALFISCISTFSFASSTSYGTNIKVDGYPDWNMAEKNNVENHCQTVAFNDPTWKKYLLNQTHRDNVCGCVTNEIMGNSTPRDFLIMARIMFRKAAISVNNYDKKAIQTSEDARVYKLYNRLNPEIIKKCATPEVANNGLTDTHQ